MFTGIVEELGIVNVIKKGVKSAQLSISAKKIFSDLKLGDSVATNGVCLTVTSINQNTFTADVMNETLVKSSLSELKAGSVVNLERAMHVNDRFGGHIVSGHIDGLGKIISITKDDIAFWYKIKTTSEIMRYIIKKGSITIDGISLTVAKLEQNSFSVSIIPHTLSNTVLKNKKIGDMVNLENDIIGKYIEKFVNNKSGITKEYLTKQGF